MLSYNGKKSVLNFWCHKVLPLVYDDSLSYYELLCKVVAHLKTVIESVDNNTERLDKLEQDYLILKNFMDNFFTSDEIQNEIKTAVYLYLNESGAISNILNEKININILEVADSVLWAQNDISDTYRGYSQQGFAIGAIGDVEYVLMLMTNDTDTVACLYNKNTGERVATKSMYLGHANGACFCSKDNLFYVALSGGTIISNQVLALDEQLNVARIETLAGVNPSSIYYDELEERFYCEGANTANIYVLDYNFTIVKTMKHNGGVHPNATYQAMSGDSNYLFFISNGLSYGNNPHFNKIDVYTHDLVYIGSSYFDNIFELEQIQHYGSDFYFCVNTNNCGYLYIGTIFDSRKLYGGRSNEYNDGLRLTPDNKIVWFNSEYTGFLSNGEFDTPIRNIYLASTVYSNRYTKFTYKLMGDYSAYNFNIKGCPFTQLEVLGYANKTTHGNVNLGGIYLEHVFKASFSNLTITKSNATDDYGVSLNDVQNVYFGSVNFSANNVPRHLSAISSNVKLVNCDFTVAPTQYYLYCTEGSFCTLDACEFVDASKPSVFLSGCNYLTSNPPLNLVKTFNLRNTAFPLLFYTNFTDSVLGLCQYGSYYFTGGCSAQDGPDSIVKSFSMTVSPYSDSLILYTLTPVNNSAVYTMLYNAINNTHTPWFKQEKTQI